MREIIQLLREYFFSLWQTLPSTGDKLLEYVWPFVQLGLKGLLWGSLKLFAIYWSLNESLFLFCINSSLLTLLILKSPLKHGHDSHQQNPYIVDNHFVVCLCRMLYRHLCKWKIQSPYNLEFYFLLFWQDYIQQKEGGFFTLGRKNIFTLSK